MSDFNLTSLKSPENTERPDSVKINLDNQNLVTLTWKDINVYAENGSKGCLGFKKTSEESKHIVQNGLIIYNFKLSNINNLLILIKQK